MGADAAAWVVRKTTIDVFHWPRFQEPLVLTTFCGGTGGRWAERRTTITGRDGGHIEGASLWVHIDMATGRPVALPSSFLEHFGESCGGRRVSGRLVHPPPATASDDAQHTAWFFRATDFDVMGHVNNAAYWEPVEETLVRDAPARYELEYRVPVEPHHSADLMADGDLVWLVGGGAVHASARVIRRS
jgi:acyl-ACP thioesterase